MRTTAISKNHPRRLCATFRAAGGDANEGPRLQTAPINGHDLARCKGRPRVRQLSLKLPQRRLYALQPVRIFGI